MYRFCAIYLFTGLVLISCGSPLKTKIENLQPELDTAFYNKYIEKGPDNNLYPTFIYTSSQREPSEKFGTFALMDGKMDTWWSSGTGLNTGEYVIMELNAIPAATCKVFIANDMIMAKIMTVSIYVNDSLYGNFSSGSPINLPRDFKKLKIVAGETDGINEVMLPILNDSTSKTQVTKKNIITRYNSKSFGIAEIEFYDKTGKKMPVRSLPVRKAIVQCAYNLNPDERHYVFDGNTSTSTQWFKAGGEGKLIFTFPEFTPFTKIRFFTGPTEFLNYGTTMDVGFQINGKKEQRYTLKTGLNEFKMTEPFVARTLTLSFYKFGPGNPNGAISEIQGFDGARWYSIEPDSMYLRADRLKDSLANTPIKAILNNQISYAFEYTLLNTDTIKVINPNEISSEYIDKKVAQRSSIVFRSNGSWDAMVTSTTITMGKKSSFIGSQKKINGDFKVASKNAEQIVLNVRYRIIETTSIDGKSSSPKTRTGSAKATITKTQLTIDGLLDMQISY